MNIQLVIVLGLLAGTVVLFATNLLRMDIVAFLVIIAFALTGILPYTEALSGFSDPNILLIALLFVIGEGLVRTGIAYRMGDFLVKKSGNSETKVMILLMVSVTTLGAFMSSTGIVAIFIPIVMSVCSKMDISPGRLMMPLSFAGLISGMTTLVATPPNLVVDGAIRRSMSAEGSFYEGFSFFAITPIGYCVLFVGIIYMLFARKFLVGRTLKKDSLKKRSMTDLVEEYKLNGKMYRFQIRSKSPLIDKTLVELGLRAKYGISVIGIERTRKFGQKVTIMPNSQTELRMHDILLVTTRERDEDLRPFYTEENLDPLPLRGEYFSEQSNQVGMAEITLNPISGLVGKSISEMAFRNNLNVNIVAIKRKKESLEGELIDIKIQSGDTILVVGDWQSIRHMHANSNIIVLNLPAEVDEVAPAAARAPYALGSIAVMVLLMVTGVVPNIIAALIACLLLGAFKCVDIDSAYKSVHWPSIILIVGMMPFARALQATGGVDLIVSSFMTIFGGYSPRIILLSLFVLCAVVGLFISNTATAVLMAPIAIAVASQMGLSPYPFAMTVMLAASAAFITPVSSPVNTLVLAPGGYKFMDYVKIGLPFTFIVMAFSVLIVPVMFPF